MGAVAVSVVHVVSPQPRGDTGGTQLHVADLAAAQLESGTVVPRVLELGDKGFGPSLAGLGVDAVTLDRPFAASAVRRTRDLLAGEPVDRPVDLVHSHGYDADFLTGLAWRSLPRRARPAWVATAHGFVVADHLSRAKTAADRWLLRHGPTAVIAVSQACAADVGGGARCVANGIPLPPPAPRRRPAAPVLLYVGRLSPEKRPDLVLRSLAALRAHVDAAAVVVGTGPEERSLRSLAGSLGVAAHVTFAGYQPDPGPFYERATALVLLSATEGTPRVVLEAMARHVPVIATRVGGVPDLVEDGVTGRLVDPAPSAAVAGTVAAVRSLLADPSGTTRLAAEASRRCRERYGAGTMARAVGEVYDAALATWSR